MNIDNKIIYKHVAAPEQIPTNGELVREYLLKNPHADKKRLEIFRSINSAYIFEQREGIPIPIDRKRENCFTIEKELTDTFTHNYKDGSRPGYFQYRIQPYSGQNSILITSSFKNGEKYQETYKRYAHSDYHTEETLAHIKIKEQLYFQEVAEFLLLFCDQYKIIDTHFEIMDLKYHLTDTSGNMYGRILIRKLLEFFEAGKFAKI